MIHIMLHSMQDGNLATNTTYCVNGLPSEGFDIFYCHEFISDILLV